MIFVRGLCFLIWLVLNMWGVFIDVGYEILGVSFVYEFVWVCGELLFVGFFVLLVV